jgi:type IV pilus assembly protein PilA
MSNSAFPPQFPQPEISGKPPNYAAGLLLNLFLPGSGFTYLGRWKPHLGWMLGLGLFTVVLLMLMVAVAASPLSGATWLLSLLPVLAYVWMLIQYHAAYAQALARFNPAAPPALSDGAKLGLILGHVALGFVGIAFIGILAAVLIPNLLGAQQRAYDTGSLSCAKSVQTALAIAQIDTETYPATVDKTVAGASEACAATQVTVTGYGSKNDYSFTVRDNRGRKTYTVTPESLTATP